MKLSFTGLLAVATALIAAEHAVAAPSPNGRKINGTPAIPSAWANVGEAAATDKMAFTLTLKNPNLAGLDSVMTAIAQDPNAKWLTDAELAQYVTPPAASQKAVTDAVGAISKDAKLTWSPLKDFVKVEMTVGEAASFLGTKFNKYSYKGSRATPKAQTVTIPAAIADVVTSVGGLNSFATYRGSPKITTAPQDAASDAQRKKSPGLPATAPGSCLPYNSTKVDALINSDRCLIDYLGIPKPGSARTQDVGIMAYIGESFSNKDLSKHMELYRPDEPAATAYMIPVVETFTAVNDPNNTGGEASLDTQIVVGTSYPLRSTFYDIGDVNGNGIPDSDSGDIFLTTMHQFLAADPATRPRVVTISYASAESDIPLEVAQAMCSSAQQLTALGTTVVVSSGDSGIVDAYETECPKFIPSYPSGCQYILSVGMTTAYGPNERTVTGDANGYGPFSSGSGFSNYFPRPKYQDAYVPAYLKKIKGLASAPTSRFNAAGRAFPDVAAQGLFYPVVQLGQTPQIGYYGGTSMSAPLVASIIANLNSKLQDAGKRTVGWFNPFVYKNPDAFADIVNAGSYWNCSGSEFGFPSSQGYDAANGLGVPLFSKIAKAYGLKA